MNRQQKKGFTPTPINIDVRPAKRAGFTLVELLVVISIIGFLSSIVLASLNTARMKARDAVRASDINQLINALALYYDDHGQVPCHTFVESQGDPSFLDPLIIGGYLTQQLHDPAETSSRSYEYWTFKNNPGGTCGQYAYIGIYSEKSVTCPSGGYFHPSEGHCHIFFPATIPCSDPKLLITNPGTNNDCNILADKNGPQDPNSW